MVSLPEGRLLHCLWPVYSHLPIPPSTVPAVQSARPLLLDNLADSHLRAFALLFPRPGIVFHRHPLVFFLHQLPAFVQISGSMRSIPPNPSYMVNCPPCLTSPPTWARLSLSLSPWASFPTALTIWFISYCNCLLSVSSSRMKSPPMLLLSMAFITNYHRLGILKQHKSVLLVLGGKIGFTGLK